jgi:hypothetical protein
MNMTIVSFALRTGLKSDIQIGGESRKVAEAAEIHERLI